MPLLGKPNGEKGSNCRPISNNKMEGTASSVLVFKYSTSISFCMKDHTFETREILQGLRIVKAFLKSIQSESFV